MRPSCTTYNSAYVVTMHAELLGKMFLGDTRLIHGTDFNHLGRRQLGMGILFPFETGHHVSFPIFHVRHIFRVSAGIEVTRIDAEAVSYIPHGIVNVAGVEYV